MLDKLRRAYRKLRYLPRHVIMTLDRIAAGVAALNEPRRESSLGDVLAEIPLFCDETTRVMLGLLSNSNATASQVANMDRRLATAEASLRELTAAFEAHRGEAAQRQAVTDATTEETAAKLHSVRETLQHMNATLHEIGVTLDGLNGKAERQSDRITHLGKVLAETARIYPSWVWTPAVAARTRRVLALLAPTSVPGVGKVRVGRDRDGGYVMLDDFDGIAAALSIGIADDVSWDSDMANRGVRVLQFDPTVAGPPASNDLFHFEALRVAPQDGDGAVSLDTIVQTRVAVVVGGETQVEVGNAALVLKIDIEGDEWPVFLTTSERTMAHFKQIVCEFHNLERLCEQEFGDRAYAVFAKLARTHFVHHVHGNNCANFANVGNVIVPESLEVSFGLRSAYNTQACLETFPTPLDCPNEPGRADLFLSYFQFDDASVAGV